MPKLTLQTQYLQALEGLGWKRVVGKSHHKIVLRHPRNPEFYIWLGKAGSCRGGHTQAMSRPLSEQNKARILEGFEPKPQEAQTITVVLPQ